MEKPGRQQEQQRKSNRLYKGCPSLRKVTEVIFMIAKRKLTAPCGLDCFNCDLYADNISEETKSRVSRILSIAEDDVICKGCRAQNGKRLNCPTCATFDCIKERGIDFCFECDQFPCSRIQPLANGFQWYPHNLKLYNLCRIRKIGLDTWIREEAAANRFRYLHGKHAEARGNAQRHLTSGR